MCICITKDSDVKLIQNLYSSEYCIMSIQFGNTALHIACYNGHKDVTEYLLKKGADPVCTDDVSTISLVI